MIEAQAIYQRCHHTLGQAACSCNLAELALRRRQWEEAEGLSQQALQLFRELEDQPGIAFTLANLAEAALHRAEHATAEQCLREALALCLQIGMRGLIPTLLELRARNQAASGGPHEAMFCLSAAQRLRGELCTPRLAEEQKLIDVVESDLLSALESATVHAIQARVASLPHERIVEEALAQEELRVV